MQDGSTEGMSSSWKIAVAVRNDLADWQKLNVVAFVSSGLASAHVEIFGDLYVDGSGRSYPSMFAMPLRVFGGDHAGIRRAFDRAIERTVTLSVYTDELFSTMNDNDNRAAVAAVPTVDLSVAGFAIAGEGKQVDKVFDKLRPHP